MGFYKCGLWGEIGLSVQNPNIFNKTERPQELDKFYLFGAKAFFYMFFDPVSG